MMSEKLKTNPMVLETITPIFIGSEKGDVLSPYSDFIVEGNSLLILDTTKIIEDLINISPDLIDRYTEGIKEKISNTRSNFDLKKFLTGHLGDLTPYVSRVSSITGRSDEKSVISRFITNAGNPFIPGTTIKGAVRTAIIYHWLTENSEGKAQMNHMISFIKSKLGTNYARKDLSGMDIETKLFGSLSDKENGMDSRHFHFSDTTVIPAQYLEIRHVSRKKVFDLTQVSPQWSELLPANIKTGFSFSIESGIRNHFLAGFSNDPSGTLLKCINAFSKASIEYEINRLSKSPDLKGKTVKFYENLLEQLNQSQQKGFLRLGRFKTYFDNSIGLAIRQIDAELFEQFRKAMELGKNPITKKVVESGFPTTRSFTESDLHPLGWVKIYPGIAGELPVPKTEMPVITVMTPPQGTKSGQSAAPTNRPSPSQGQVKAVITDSTSKPPRVKILEGPFLNAETILSGVNLNGLGLTAGHEVLVVLDVIKGKTLQKATYKGKV
ncbi:MAG: type III-A CRISPR-associated RAMP protein Csm5 [Bacteroidetes bacterium]|nr:type III-A CRISPR-associated RAMP protein Csm5 [Bacteroidota bacterium]